MLGIWNTFLRKPISSEGRQFKREVMWATTSKAMEEGLPKSLGTQISLPDAVHVIPGFNI